MFFCHATDGLVDMTAFDENSMKRLLFGFSSKKSAMLAVITLLLLVAGLYFSFYVVAVGIFGWDGNSDANHSIMLWYSIKEHGLYSISEWIFSQDNWLLSLDPLAFFGFLIFGPEPSVAVILGRLIFVASALVSGVIAWKLNAGKAACIITALLLNMGLCLQMWNLIRNMSSVNQDYGLPVQAGPPRNRRAYGLMEIRLLLCCPHRLYTKTTSNY
jgi:hypothetical protein